MFVCRDITASPHLHGSNSGDKCSELQVFFKSSKQVIIIANRPVMSADCVTISHAHSVSCQSADGRKPAETRRGSTLQPVAFAFWGVSTVTTLK